MAWTGFTDEQLMHLKHQSDDTEEDYPESDQPRKPAQHGRRGAPRRMPANRNAAQRGRGPRPPISSVQHAEPLSPSQMLSRPKEVPNRHRPQQRPRPSSAGSGSNDSEHKVRNAKSKPSSDERSGPREKNDHSVAHKKLGGQDVKCDGDTTLQEDEVENKEVVSEELDEKEGISRELTKLEKFQEEQKKMEEENAKRKALLAKAIADRKKKTQAETKRLAYIQKELSKIEDLLTNDVRILRDKIEDVSRTYLGAQKRYQKAESEFVAAKIHLHKVQDMKESLTDHLCTIIHENEIRKSKKLEELVSKLEVDNLEEFEKQLNEESNVPQSPSHKSSENIQPTTINESRKPSQATDEKPSSDETSNNTTAAPSNGLVSSSDKEETKVPQKTDGKADVNSEKGANQESANSTASIPAREPGEKEDLQTHSDLGQKIGSNQTVITSVTDPPSVS